MKVEELQNIVNTKIEAVVDNWTITPEQAQKLLYAYDALPKQEQKQLFLQKDPVALLSWLGKIGFSVAKSNA